MTTQKRFSGFQSFGFPFFQAREFFLKIRISRDFRIRLRATFGPKFPRLFVYLQ